MILPPYNFLLGNIIAGGVKLVNKEVVKQQYAQG